MLVMDTRCRAGPLRPAVCDGMRKYVSRAGDKDNSMLAFSSSPKKTHATATPAPGGRVGAGTDSGASATNSVQPDKTAVEVRMARTESNVSRPSTPVTESSSWCPSSGSSFATSVYPDAESGCPKDDVSGGHRSDWRSASTSGDMKRLDEADMAAVKGALNPHTLRQSHLRNCMFAHSGPTGDSSSSIDLDECDDHNDDSYGDDEDNDWSGENDTLDVAIIDALDGDLSLAAFLIPLLHRDMRNAVRHKVDSWQIDPESHAGLEDGEGSSHGKSSSRHGGSGSFADGASTSHSRGGHSSGQERKRRRHRSGSDNGQDDEDEEGGGEDYEAFTGWEKGQMPFLACPFHKLNPGKYGIQHGNGTGSSRQGSFRACAGPGFKSIQRLKEHLKRKHTPVQCDRCWRIFSGSDKQACMRQLSAHRQRDVPCQRGDPSHREGISEDQWVALDNKSRKKNQETHKVEKWFEIWRVLFPEVPEPDTPWYDDVAPTRYQTPSRESEAFAELFLTMLNHKLQMGDMGFPDCNTEEVAQRLRNLVQQTFRTYVSLHGPLSRTTDTSSSHTGTNNLPTSSHVGGSSTHQSYPNTNSTSQNPMTNTTRTTTTALSQTQVQQMLQMQMTAGNGNGPVFAANLYAVPGIPAGGVPMMHGQLPNGGGGQQNIQYAPVPVSSTTMMPALPQSGLEAAGYTHLPEDFLNSTTLSAWQAGPQSYGNGVGSNAMAMATGPGAHYGPGSEMGFFSNDGTYTGYPVG